MLMSRKRGSRATTSILQLAEIVLFDDHGFQLGAHNHAHRYGHPGQPGTEFLPICLKPKLTFTFTLALNLNLATLELFS